MSYILDALNKSEKEQDPQSVPGVTTYSHSSPKTRHSRVAWFAGSLLLLLLVNAVTIYYWMKDQPVVDSLSLEAQAPASISQEEELPLIISPKLPTSRLTSLSNLPPSIQKKVSSMHFSSHIYSEHSDLRAVNIDGVNFTESEMVTQDLKLEQVTSEGIILNYLDQRFEVSVIDEWADAQG